VGKLKHQPAEGMFWWATAALLAFLALNEILDLQTHLTSIGRTLAKAHGWYGEHRGVQYLFVLALGLGAMLVGIATMWLTRRMHSAVRTALAGLIFIGLFVLLRAASFHHLDDFLGSDAAVFSWGSIQELAGIIIVAAAAAYYARNGFRSAQAPSVSSFED
jgi:hypothetical protein